MSTYSSALEASASRTNEKQHLKTNLDREYKLLTANQSLFSNSKTFGRDAMSGSGDQFWKEASIRSERKPSNKEEVSSPVEGLPVENNYYKNGIQNLRSSLNEMREKAMKTKFVTSQLRSTNVNELDAVTELDKDRIKQIQAEREQDVAESLSQREGAYSSLEKNPINSAGKKRVRMAYEQKEKEVHDRVIGNSAGKDRDEYLNSNWNSKLSQSGRSDVQRSPDALPEEDGGLEKEERDQNSSGYFTNKELVRAKYEQYEKDLLKKKEKGQSRRRLEESGSAQKEESIVQSSAEKRNERREIGERKQSNLYPVREESENDRFQDRGYASVNRSQSRDNVDEFSRALEKKDRKIQEEYDDIIREKSWRNRGLVYKEYEQSGARYEDDARYMPEYPVEKLPNNQFLELELEKLKEENQRIKREIQDIQYRNNIEKRHNSAKLTQKDFRNSFVPQNNFTGSQKLKTLKNQRRIEDEEDFGRVLEGEDIQKTIQRARKSVHKKMETSKLERSWKEARNKSTADLSEDVFLGYKTTSRSGKFHAGTPSNHLRESAFLLAKGIPTVYVSNRNINHLTKSARNKSARSFRK